jgi:hypothetical protein
MASLFHGRCKLCNHSVGPIVDYPGSIYFCPTCTGYHQIADIPRRFDLPTCPDCSQQMTEEDRVRNEPTRCPSCAAVSVNWETNTHLLMNHVPEAPPAIGDLVQGYITNTGSIQRIELVNSIMRGRLNPDETDVLDGTPVEAEVMALGSRSIDVELVRELKDVPRRKKERENKAMVIKRLPLRLTRFVNALTFNPEVEARSLEALTHL